MIVETHVCIPMLSCVTLCSCAMDPGGPRHLAPGRIRYPVKQGEPLVERHLSNPGDLRKWRTMRQI